MKKIVTIILSLVLLCSITPCQNTEAASDINRQAGKAYAEIIKKHMEVNKIAREHPGAFTVDEKEDGHIGSYVNSDIHYNGKLFEDINYIFVYGTDGGYDFSNKRVSYKITDTNKDGVPELYIGLSGWVYSAYTFRNGKAVKQIDWQGDRAGTGILCKNGIIKTESGISSAGEADFYKITKNQTVKIVLSLNYDTQYSQPYYTQRQNGKTMKIDEAEYNRLYAKYDKPIKTTFYKADSKALKNIKQGKFSFKGQKSWKV